MQQSRGLNAPGPGARSQVRDVGPAHQTSPEERRSDLDLVGVVLDGLSAWCAHRLGLAALSRVFGDDASAAPGSAADLADGCAPDMVVKSITNT